MGKIVSTLSWSIMENLTAESVLAEESVKPALVSSDITSEWKKYHRYITQQPKEDIKAQLKELTTNSMLIAMFPNLSVIPNICLSIPVGTASVEWSFSQMKMIKTQLRNRLGEISLLIKIVIESPQKNCWSRLGRVHRCLGQKATTDCCVKLVIYTLLGGHKNPKGGGGGGGGARMPASPHKNYTGIYSLVW